MAHRPAEPPQDILLLLQQHGLPTDGLIPASGVANEVWLTETNVIRINGGRFLDAFHHEANVLALLPPEIPHPEALAVGYRDTEAGEFLILSRIPGRTLDEAWPHLDREARHHIGQDLALIAQTLHSLPITDTMRNPWVDEAITTPILANCYHSPPSFSPSLINGARVVRPDLSSTLDELDCFLRARRFAFADDTTRPEVFVHADLHFRNVLIADGRISGIIDFEGSRPAQPDVELDTLLRFPGSARQFGTDSISTASPIYDGLINDIKEAYPELFAHPHLVERLEVYDALWQLVQLHNWRPEYQSFPDPAIGIRALMSGSLLTAFRHLLR